MSLVESDLKKSEIMFNLNIQEHVLGLEAHRAKDEDQLELIQESFCRSSYEIKRG